MRVLESERLILKPIELEDLEYLLNLRWDLKVVNYIIHEPLSMKDQLNWFNSLSKKDVVLAIFVKDGEDLKIMGTLGIFNINTRHQRASWRLRVDPAFQGKGYATEASRMLLEYGFNTLNLNKLTADSFADNEAIFNVLAKLGFKKEGFLSQHFFYNGAFKDAIVSGLLREDYNKMKKSKTLDNIG